MSNAPPVFPPARNPDDLGRGPMIMGITWTFTSLAILAMSLRVIARRNTARKLAVDDWLMGLAVLFQVANQVLITVSFSWGLGKHDVDLQMPDQLVQVLKYDWLAVAPGMMVSILARISITILLIRLFGLHKWFKSFLVILTTIQVIMAILVFIFTFTQMTPIEGLWNVFLPNVRRWDYRILLYTQYIGQSTYTFADLAYVVLPIAIIWKLNMSMNRRIGLILLLGVSAFTAFTSIMKTIVATSGVHMVEDAQYKASLAVLWSSLEQACVVFLGCVPPLYSTLKIKIEFISVRSIGNSLSGLFRSSKRANRATFTSGKSGSYHGGTGAGDRDYYHDLERDAQLLSTYGYPKTEVESKRTMHYDTTSNKSLTGEFGVRRTDTFTLSNEPRDRYSP